MWYFIGVAFDSNRMLGDKKDNQKCGILAVNPIILCPRARLKARRSLKIIEEFTARSHFFYLFCLPDTISFNRVPHTLSLTQ